MQKKIKNVKQSLISIDKHCKYCLKPIAFYDLRCNGNCNTVAHYTCTIRAYKSIQINDHPDHFLCLWCSVFKLEENACRQFEVLADETNNSDKSDDDISENSYKNIVTSKQSTNIPPFSLKTPLSPSKSSRNSNEKSLKTNTVKNTVKSQSIFSTPVSCLLPNECFHLKPTSCESDILNQNNTALSENSNKNIDTPETSSNIPLETLDVESSGNSSLGFFKTLFTSPTKRSLNVTPKTPISESSQINEIVNKSIEIDTPITPKTQNSFSLSPSPRASSPLVFRFLSSETKRDPHKKTQHFSEHTVEEFSNQYILQEMFLNLKQCKALLQQQVFYQRTTNSFEKEKSHHLKSLEDLMKLNCDILRTMQTQIYTIQEQYIELCSHLKNILEK
ncbi:hypothetical protein ALC53_08794 [Atta colombica]|uniref:Uncharacterized protein n=1 Tax=Atta colombica TaxID=520822 RepID=A0A195B8D3_9HYME|nr:hypothetical protein ALC53_08794 [Atta colombica]